MRKKYELLSGKREPWNIQVFHKSRLFSQSETFEEYDVWVILLRWLFYNNILYSKAVEQILHGFKNGAIR